MDSVERGCESEEEEKVSELRMKVKWGKER